MNECLSHIGVVIPTFNAESHWPILQAALDQQGVCKSQIVVIDSASSDRTPALVKQAGYTFVSIPKGEFRHGRTRQAARGHLPSAEIVVYLTQDAVPADPGSIERLCSAFSEPRIGAAYGRQLPRRQAGPIEVHARTFNYPDVSDVRTLESRARLGMKAIFLSNSFAAYRATALDAIGGFPDDVIMGEDTIVAGRMLLKGWRIAYQADATVIHSHSLSVKEEFARYFDTGVFHNSEAWLLETFGQASSEGRKFVLSELDFLRRRAPHLLPEAVVRTASKWIAYQMGRRQQSLPNSLNRRLSSYPGFWAEDKESFPA